MTKRKHDNDVYCKTLGLFVEDRVIKTVTFYPFQSRKTILNENNTLYNQEGATEYLERERTRWYNVGYFGSKRLYIKEV